MFHSPAKPYSVWKIAICLSAAMLCGAVFVLGMALLPQSPLPLWLPLSAAAAGGGLCAWFVFVPRALRKQKTFSHGWARLLAFVCAGVLCAFALELFGFNHRAFVTRSCIPQPLELSRAEDAEENGLPLVVGENGAAEVRFTVSHGETRALRVVLDGNAHKADIVISIRDEASAHGFTEAAEGFCLPGAPGYDTYDAPLYSSGSIKEIKLNISFPATVGEDMPSEVSLRSVILDPQVPVRWEWLRMILCCLAVVLVCCLCRFPWRGVVYQPKKLTHRLVIMLPTALMLALALWMTVACMLPLRSMRGVNVLLKGSTLEEASRNTDDAYGMLFSALLKGQLAIAAEPSDELLAMETPYDSSARFVQGVSFLYDYALYEGKYYVYYGIAPVLLFYFPYYWLTGRVPSELLSTMVMAALLMVLTGYALVGLVRKYGKNPNLFLLSLSCAAVACAAGWPDLIVGASKYANVVACNIAMMAGAIGFGFHATLHGRGWPRSLLLILCGLCFALQCMSRANTLLMTIGFLAPAFVAILMDKKSKWWAKLGDAASFLIPALLGIGFAMWYNQARFHSPFEFGSLYQLTAVNILHRSFLMEYIPQALWHFLLDMPRFLSTFPYVQAVDSVVNVTGSSLFHMNSVGILAYPLLWVLVLGGGSMRLYREDDRALRLQRGFTLWTPLVMALLLMVITYFYAGVIQRYAYDFLLAFALVAAFVGLTLCSPEGGEYARMHCVGYIALCVLTILLALAFAFAPGAAIEQNSPEIYYGLKRMFFPY